ncbi:MAG: sigma-70 family RNA polymerase sigma factor [Verrucomicrobia bacterium]|nr:sigma-70 family RNA polymerase sigma factor [Verrucomicrobiota bacterium]
MPEDATATTSDIAWLTARMAKGDETAYRLFYERYFHRLLRYLIVLARGHEDAAREALQSTLVRVVRHIHTFDSEESFWSWLTVLARSSVADEGRKRRRYLSLLDRFFLREQIAADLAGSQPETRLLELLEANLAGLPPEDRELIERKYFDRESVRTLAEEMNTTEKAVESRLVRARRKLKNLILGELDHETSNRS